MHPHSDLKRKNCYTCEYYCAHRELRNSFSSTTLYVDYQGTCSNRMSSSNGKQVNDENWCSYHKTWDAVQKQLNLEEEKKKLERLKEEQKREAEKIAKENERIRKEQEEQIRKLKYEQNKEAERIAYEARKLQQEQEARLREIEREKERLEYERWYSSLTPNERRKEDERIAEKKRQEEKEIQEWKARIEAQAEARRQRHKKLIPVYIAGGAVTGLTVFTILNVLFVGALAIVLIPTISSTVKTAKFNNSDTGKVLKSIRNDSGGKDAIYFTVNNTDGTKASMALEYKKGGFVDGFGLKRDFRAICQLTPREEDHFVTTTGYVFFSLSGTSEKSEERYLNGAGACYASNASYGYVSEVFTQYRFVTYDSSTTKLNYLDYDDIYTNWDWQYSDYSNEWKDRGFLACGMANNLVNQYCVSALNSPFWK